MGEKSKIVDLEYIREMTDNEEAAIKEMVDLFIEQIPMFIDELKNDLKTGNWQELAGMAHQVKSSVAIMGMEETASLLKELEINAKKKAHVQQYPKMISRIEHDCRQAIEELKSINRTL